MKLTGDWITNTATQSLFDNYEKQGYQLFFVGGCVRDALLGKPVADVDMASNAVPTRAISFLEEAGFRIIPTGVDHGTITVLSGDTPHEITTFRKDVETDGRRAVVSFSKTILEDAMRRDFTINALYADRWGTLHDPVGGLADVAPTRVRFIGKAEDRIREDYLRSLRYFRFHARYVAAETGFDPEALDAISRTLDGLEALSRERVGTEFLKLLAADDPALEVATMHRIGVLSRLLPGADPRALAPLVHLEGVLGLPPNPIRRLAALVGEQAGKRLRLSRAQAHALVKMRSMAMSTESPAGLGYKLGSEMAKNSYALRLAFLSEDGSPEQIEALHLGARAIFPVTARDLMPDYAGAELGARLRELEDRWISSEFRLSKSELLG